MNKIQIIAGLEMIRFNFDPIKFLIRRILSARTRQLDKDPKRPRSNINNPTESEQKESRQGHGNKLQRLGYFKPADAGLHPIHLAARSRVKSS